MANQNKLFPAEEQALLLEVAAGNQAAFVRLFNAYKDRLFTIAYKVTESAPQSEEIVQDVFVKLWMGRQRLPEITRIEAYLLTAIRNHAFTALKQKARQPRVTQELTDNEATISLEIETYLQHREYQEMLQKAMQVLPPQQRQVFKLIKIEGMSREEAAASMNISPASVKVHLALAMRTVRDFCKDWMKICLIILLASK